MDVDGLIQVCRNVRKCLCDLIIADRRADMLLHDVMVLLKKADAKDQDRLPSAILDKRVRLIHCGNGIAPQIRQLLDCLCDWKRAMSIRIRLDHSDKFSILFYIPVHGFHVVPQCIQIDFCIYSADFFSKHILLHIT